MAYQEKRWQDFYERAWGTRAEYMDELLSGGGYNTYQIISKLENKERLCDFYVNNDGEGHWQRKKVIGDKFNFAQIPTLKTTSLNGMFINVPFYTNTSHVQLIIDVFNETGPYDSILELGCGYGQNLFKLFYQGGFSDIKYFGGEFTNSGVEIARKLAQNEPHMRADFFHFNHLKPEISGFDFGERVLVFTMHTIEQVQEIADDWFSVVAKIADFVRCVNIEPFGFQIKELGEASKGQSEFFSKTGWNSNFAKTLKQANLNNEICIEDALLEYSCGTDPYNPTSVAIWHNKTKD
ncbi:hypothetical protein CIG11343_1047 [Campylobacter iguaniorum]|uniref:class I SAM-dependent methyltransferase n=1 Tax=Campylobacter iguaniorum TaxID=1244531 RepID=UPI0007C8C24D|nr:class I SAM-dependent methyltransferase [Campylobacter iguaniorum]ANE36061.1 hypothetical protein CIG11343_1047 [Campylobacter iguaniorum]